MSSDMTIRRESKVAADLIPPLDPALLNLSHTEHAFLCQAISSDEDELHRRILAVQKESYEQHPYPCIRAFHFVSLMMLKNSVYGTVLDEGKRGGTLFLDLGCCMGSDVRKLVADGYPASHVLGCDLRPDYIALGYRLYKDADICPIRFFTDDIFTVPVPAPLGRTESSAQNQEFLDVAKVYELKQLTGRLSHIYSGALFHLFDETTQYAIAIRVAVLINRKSNAVIFGRHQGKADEGMLDDHLGRIRYGHSPASWTRLWHAVFTELEDAQFVDEHIVVRASFGEEEDTNGRIPTSSRMMYWSVSVV